MVGEVLRSSFVNTLATDKAILCNFCYNTYVARGRFSFQYFFVQQQVVISFTKTCLNKNSLIFCLLEISYEKCHTEPLTKLNFATNQFTEAYVAVFSAKQKYVSK